MGNSIWVAAARDDAEGYGPDWRTLVLQDRCIWAGCPPDNTHTLRRCVEPEEPESTAPDCRNTPESC